MTKEKKALTKKEHEEEQRNVIMTALSLLTGVVQRNTEVMEMVLKALQTPQPVGDTSPRTQDIYTREDCQQMIVDLLATEGKETTMELLNNHEAKKLSDLKEKHFESFIMNGRHILEYGVTQ